MKESKFLRARGSDAILPGLRLRLRPDPPGLPLKDNHVRFIKRCHALFANFIDNSPNPNGSFSRTYYSDDGITVRMLCIARNIAADVFYTSEEEKGKEELSGIGLMVCSLDNSLIPGLTVDAPTPYAQPRLLRTNGEGRWTAISIPKLVGGQALWTNKKEWFSVASLLIPGQAGFQFSPTLAGAWQGRIVNTDWTPASNSRIAVAPDTSIPPNYIGSIGRYFFQGNDAVGFSYYYNDVPPFIHKSEALGDLIFSISFDPSGWSADVAVSKYSKQSGLLSANGAVSGQIGTGDDEVATVYPIAFPVRVSRGTAAINPDATQIYLLAYDDARSDYLVTLNVAGPDITVSSTNLGYEIAEADQIVATGSGESTSTAEVFLAGYADGVTIKAYCGLTAEDVATPIPYGGYTSGCTWQQTYNGTRTRRFYNCPLIIGGALVHEVTTTAVTANGTRTAGISTTVSSLGGNPGTEQTSQSSTVTWLQTLAAGDRTIVTEETTKGGTVVYNRTFVPDLLSGQSSDAISTEFSLTFSSYSAALLARDYDLDFVLLYETFSAYTYNDSFPTFTNFVMSQNQATFEPCYARIKLICGSATIIIHEYEITPSIPEGATIQFTPEFSLGTSSYQPVLIGIGPPGVAVVDMWGYAEPRTIFELTGVNEIPGDGVVPNAQPAVGSCLIQGESITHLLPTSFWTDWSYGSLTSTRNRSLTVDTENRIIGHGQMVDEYSYTLPAPLLAGAPSPTNIRVQMARMPTVDGVVLAITESIPDSTQGVRSWIYGIDKAGAKEVSSIVAPTAGGQVKLSPQFAYNNFVSI